MNPMEITNCHDCAAKPGERHDPGCDVERCMLCGYQRIGCGCVYKANGMDVDDMEETHPEIYYDGPTAEMCAKYDAEVAKVGGPEIWTGVWPGMVECREHDLWCKWVEGKGWVRCGKEDPEAREDLAQLMTTCEWSREKRKWVRR